RAAAAKTIGYDDGCARARGLDRRTRSCGAEADYQHVAIVIPANRLLAVGAKRRADRGGSRIARVDRGVRSDARRTKNLYSITIGENSVGGPRKPRPDGG